MATKLNLEGNPTSEIEPNSKSSIENLSITPTADDLQEYFEDSNDILDLDTAGNVIDESAIWVYFGVGGPA